MWKTELTELLEKYRGKKVLITGNTGFKGTWLTRILLNYGAIVYGYGLKPSATQISLFNMINENGKDDLMYVFADIRDLDKLRFEFERFNPEIVFHLAAQPIVRDGYRNPVDTYSTNVMGTVNLLECVRHSNSVHSVVNVTTDKVYKNNEWVWGYRENESLDGYDPYSNSKSCSELVTHSYKLSFLNDKDIRISTARAGNVIGGGDYANDRIIPDCIRSVQYTARAKNKEALIKVRNPYSIRPYQYVLEPLMMYLTIAMKQYEDASYQGCYNIGPDECDCVTTGELVNLFCEKWNEQFLECDTFPKASWESGEECNAPHEATFLKLDCSSIKNIFGWRPVWHIDRGIEETVRFTKIWLSGENVAEEMDKEIRRFIDTVEKGK